jgi:hypothetical protein
LCKKGDSFYLLGAILSIADNFLLCTFSSRFWGYRSAKRETRVHASIHPALHKAKAHGTNSRRQPYNRLAATESLF